MNLSDTKSIKYVLKEMDPAEQVEFEREMMQNPDLRIEVESIRRMNNKINNLPELTPPVELTSSVLDFASSRGKTKNTSSGKSYFLSAAVLILGLTTGSLILQQPFGLSDDTAGDAAISMQGSSNKIDQPRQNAIHLKPWTDRNNVLHLSRFEGGDNSMPDSELVRSLNKLRPAGNSSGINSFQRSIQLTNSNR